MKLCKAKGSESVVPASGWAFELPHQFAQRGVYSEPALQPADVRFAMPRTEVVFAHPWEDGLTLHLPLQHAVLIFCWKKTDFSSKYLCRQTRLCTRLCKQDLHSGNTEFLSLLQIVFVYFTSHNKFMFYCYLFKENPTDWSSFITWLV